MVWMSLKKGVLNMFVSGRRHKNPQILLRMDCVLATLHTFDIMKEEEQPNGKPQGETYHIVDEASPFCSSMARKGYYFCEIL